jgi:hypothetical protein
MGTQTTRECAKLDRFAQALWTIDAALRAAQP